MPQVSRSRSALEGSSDIWIARTVLNGSGGAGIIVVRPGDPIPDAPLYTKYVRKSREYRLHVVGGEVIFYQEKRKKNGVEQTRDQALIRNHDNGWVFAENDIRLPESSVWENVKATAVGAVRALGLDFGAVDLVLARDNATPYVLEVNTAPGIESTRLLEAYVRAFKAAEND